MIRGASRAPICKFSLLVDQRGGFIHDGEKAALFWLIDTLRHFQSTAPVSMAWQQISTCLFTIELRHGP